MADQNVLNSRNVWKGYMNFLRLFDVSHLKIKQFYSKEIMSVVLRSDSPVCLLALKFFCTEETDMTTKRKKLKLLYWQTLGHV